MTNAILQTDCDWLALHIATCFECDCNGRLIARPLCGPGRDPAPRFYLGRTRHGNLWRIRADQPRSVVRGLSRLASRERILSAEELGAGTPAPPERSVFLLRELGEAAPPPPGRRAGLYRLSIEEPARSNAPSQPALAAGLKRVEPEDIALEREVLECFPECSRDCGTRNPLFAYTESGGVLSACWTRYELNGRAVEAQFETRPEARGRGLAGACLLAWARAVRDAGAAAQLAIDWRNAGARAVVRKLGLNPYADELLLD